MRQNNDMRKITSCAAIITSVPTMMAGIYGMNCTCPNCTGSTAIPRAALITVVCAGLFRVFRRNQWL